MGKRIIRLLWVCLFSCLFAPGVRAEEAQDEEVFIEQVYLNMPEVTVYGYGIGMADGQAQAYLGEEKLTPVSEVPFAQSGQGIEYYILLDISNSMPDGYFDKLKTGIGEFFGSLSDRDKAYFITFGETVTLQAEAAEGADRLQAVLDGIDNTDNKTLLFEAVSRAAELSGQTAPADGQEAPADGQEAPADGQTSVADGQASPADMQALRRKAVIVISDGEDVAVGRKMAQETLEELKEKAMPVYALCIKDTARDNINSFGEFARMSGGAITVFEEEKAGQALSDLSRRLMSAEVMSFTASSNKITNKYQQFSLRMPGRQVPLNREVLSFRWIPDTTAPELISARQLEGRQIQVSFSEPVAGNDIATHYILKNHEKIIPISGVAYSEDEANTVIITAAQPFTEGTYTVSCSNITDDSQESNPVGNALSLTLADSDPTVEEESPDMPVAVLAGIVALMIVALAFAAVIIYLRVRKNRGVVFVEGKAVMASAVDVRQHVAMEEAKRQPFELLVTVAGKNPRKLELSIDRSMMVGRSDICDLFFDDTRMSRQHFALEWDGGSMYITDLDTTNGTSVNGVKIQERRKLEQGDRICAGSEELVINW